MLIRTKKIQKISIRKNITPLSFVKGTPVLPVVTKKDVTDIIDLLEELKDEAEFYDNEDASDT
ncbi:TPA: hypothetical protein DCR49_11290 [Candidatus Delongbacteria bacterium]|nr:MAG: hypothetical protein A2Y39_02055 [Candidatus Delongbacteria bacterium GWF2_40_14]HAQ62556.1 hypothetical protein [Candidatus Delongbacteria bacterium]